MANYDLNTQQVKDNVQASSLSPSLKGAISNLLGKAADTTLDKLLAEPHTTVEIGRATGFALAEAGGKYTATSDTRVIIIEGDAPTELDVSIEDPSAQFVVVGGTGADAITLTDASVLASADGEVGVATIDGSDGDDLIVGSIGNDRLSGSNGNDTVFGGEGNDFIDGGADNDILNGGKGNDRIITGAGSDTVDGGSGYDQVVIGGDRAAHTVVVNGDKLEITSGGETKTVTGAEFISFDQGGPIVVTTDQDQGTVARLYEAMLDRSADPDGLGNWLNWLANGGTLSDIAQGFAGSAEFANLTAGKDDATFVEAMYQRTFDRSADPDGMTTWLGQLQSGAMDRATVALNFAASEEAQAKFDYVKIVGIVNQTNDDIV
jgi:Ca2+-binding RTX toxin-like protein